MPEEDVFCDKCGHRNKPKSKKCDKCGKVFEVKKPPKKRWPYN